MFKMKKKKDYTLVKFWKFKHWDFRQKKEEQNFLSFYKVPDDFQNTWSPWLEEHGFPKQLDRDPLSLSEVSRTSRATPWRLRALRPLTRTKYLRHRESGLEWPESVNRFHGGQTVTYSNYRQRNEKKIYPVELLVLSCRLTSGLLISSPTYKSKIPRHTGTCWE